MGVNSSSYHGEDEECVSEGGGVIKRIPIEVKPRGRLGIRSTAGNGAYSQQKPGSTRSVLSIHEENHELEKLRRQYEMYRLDKDNECAVIEKRRKKYETQYRRLNAELQTVQNTCKKLRNEKDAALRAEHQAVVRASAFQQDRDVVQRQFKIYRESKEKELQALLKEKRHLETTVRSRRISLTVTDDENNTWWPDSEPSLGSMSQLNTAHLSTYELDKIDDSPYLHVNRDDWLEVRSKVNFNDSLNNLIDLCVIPNCERSEECSFQLSLKLADRFYLKFLEQNLIFCSTQLKLYTQGSKVSEYLKVKKSSFLVLFLSDTEFNKDYQTILSSITARLPNTEIINYSGETKEIPFDFLSKVLNQRYFSRGNTDDYKVDKNICHLDICDTENVDALWDILDEQKQLFNESIQSNCQLSFEKLYDKLSSHVSHTGPSPPLLVYSETACGKSLLLTKWIELHRTKTPNSIIIWHLIGVQNTSSACASLVIRRLTFELIKLLPTSSLQSLTSDSNRVFADFPRLLEKVCNFHNNVIIILDSLDRIQDANKLFSWLLDPLPVNCKVIVSSDTVFHSWQSWQCLRVGELISNHARELVKNCTHADVSANPRTVVDSIFSAAGEEEDKDNADACFNPLFCILLSDISLGLPEILQGMQCVDLDDLYLALLKHLDLNSIENQYSKQILLLVSQSRNGLSQYELLQLLAPPIDHEEFLHYEYLMLRYRMLRQTSGLYIICNKEVGPDDVELLVRIEKILYDHYEYSEVDKVSTCELLKNYFDKLIGHGLMTMRIADEIPYINKSLCLQSDLKSNLLNLDLFLQYYKRGRCCELLDLWQYLQIDRKNIAFLYKEILDKLHSFDDKNSEIFHAVGKFLRDLAMLSSAQLILQKSLEIREANLDPDDCRIAESLHDLADLNLIQERYQIAEQLYRQALDIYINTFGHDHCITACEMNSMVNVLLKQSRISQAEPIRKKVFNIHKNCFLRRNNRTKKQHFNRNTLIVEKTLSSIANNADMARTLNELGVLQYLQQDTETAENLLIKSLQIREQMASPGESSNEVAQSLCNLAALYFDGKRYSLALPLYEKALDIRRKNFEKHHTSIITVVKNLALCNNKMNNIDQAITYYIELLDSQTRSLSLSHPVVAVTMVNLAVLYSQQNDYTKARGLFERAIVVYEQLYGENDIRLADTIRNLAVLEYKQEEFEKAALLYKRAKKVKENLIQSNNNS